MSDEAGAELLGWCTLQPGWLRLSGGGEYLPSSEVGGRELVRKLGAGPRKWALSAGYGTSEPGCATPPCAPRCAEFLHRPAPSVRNGAYPEARAGPLAFHGPTVGNRWGERCIRQYGYR